MLKSDYVFLILIGSKYYSFLDILKGYYQVEIKEANREKIAFVSYKCLYQYKWLPFGLKNASTYLQ